MKPVRVRGIEIGCGIPKICAPVVGVKAGDILQAGANIAELDHVDIAEWRADWYKDIFDAGKTAEVLKDLRIALGNKPLLFTFRTSGEGGQKAIGIEAYIRLNEMAAQSGHVDLMDVEVFAGDKVVERIAETAHRSHVKVMASNHDFHKTPSKAELVERLCRMHKLGADIAKIAVMPENKKDVITLLGAAAEMTSKQAHKPIVAISMGHNGMVSRFCSEAFGSALTFASVGNASAPGQIDAGEIHTILNLMHKAFVSQPQ